MMSTGSRDTERLAIACGVKWRSYENEYPPTIRYQPTPMPQNILIVTVESLAPVRARSDDALERALTGENPKTDAPKRLSFETTDQLVSVFTPRAIDLLQSIAREEPESMREAARLVGRDVKQVSENLNKLEEFGVVEFVENGRAKKPIVPFDEIDIRLQLREDHDTDAAMKA